MTIVYPEFAPKVGIQGVHFNPKFEAAVKILAPNRKCIFKSPVRGCWGETLNRENGVNCRILGGGNCAGQAQNVTSIRAGRKL